MHLNKIASELVKVAELITKNVINLNAGLGGDNADSVVKIIHIGEQVKIKIIDEKGNEKGKIEGIVEKISKKTQTIYHTGDTIETMNESWKTKRTILTVSLVNSWLQHSKVTFYGAETR
jgi:hypothetical protein